MSSCQKKLVDEGMQAEIKAEREAEIAVSAKVFLKDVILNMCALEGISGNIDTAFGINRLKIIIKVLNDLSKELEEDDE